MNEPILMARVDAAPDGRVLVVAPLVGTWSDHPNGGALVGPGSRIGYLSHLTRRYALVLPEGASGRIASVLPRDRAVAVEYGQPLFELAPVDEAVPGPFTAHAGRLGRPPGAALPEGAWAVVSPTDGVYYRRPSPAAPPFVEEGARIRIGDPVGLVEVMKTFNQIAYGGPGLPEEAQVIEIRRGDAEEVRAGDVLLVVR